MEILLKGLECLRCGHQWKPRGPGVPQKCPACDSSKWQVPRGEGLPPHLEEVFRLYEVPADQQADIVRYLQQNPGVDRALLEAVPDLEKIFGQARRRLELDRDPESVWEELFAMVVMKSEPEDDLAPLHQFRKAFSSRVPRAVQLALTFDVVTEDDYAI